MSEEQRFSNVWAAIEDTLPAAASMQARSSLMMAVQSWAKAKDTQAEAAQILGITQPRMSDLMRGKINLFSLDSLLDMAALAGLQPQVTVNLEVTESIGANVKKRYTTEVGASASDGVICELRSADDDGNRFVVGTGTSHTQSTASESRLTLVKIERVA